MVENAYKTYRIKDVDKSPWRSFVVFGQIAGKWWLSIWVLVVLSGVVTLALTITNVNKLPTSIWGSLFGLGFILAPLVAFHFLRIECDNFKALWDDKDKIISLLKSVEDLRGEAVDLQVRGMNLESLPDVNHWIKDVDDWTKRTIKTVGLLHPAEAGNVSALGVFQVYPADGTHLLSQSHYNALTSLLRRVEILGELRERWIARTI
jgi:hypothetical protein